MAHHLMRRPAAGYPSPWTSMFGPMSPFPTSIGQMLDEVLRREPASAPYPMLDVDEQEKEIRVTAEVPGMRSEDVQIEVAPSGDALTIRGEKKRTEERKEGGFQSTERMYGAFHRSIALPTRVDPNQANASLKDGVLTVLLPKANGESGPKRVDIQTS